MFKKMLIIASMALALVAIAAPASALANWTQSGVPLEEGENPHLSLAGPAAFTVPAGEFGVSATLTATIQLTGGTTTAHIISLKADNCKGSGKLAGLNCTSTFTYGDVDCISGGQLVITDVTWHIKYYSPLDPNHTSPVASSTVSGDIDAAPDNSEEIGSVSLSSENAESSGATGEVTGNLAVSPAGEYGCE
ncbi:MAG TPA: hypothetical protein VD761_10325 [Solirubrobacterales bacterium]|nr:hypothetical protein [Solirubrobacterales bacterium]